MTTETKAPSWHALKLSQRLVCPDVMLRLHKELKRPCVSCFPITGTHPLWARVCRTLTVDHVRFLAWLMKRQDLVHAEIRGAYQLLMDPDDPTPSYDRFNRHSYSYSMAIIQVLMLQCDVYELEGASNVTK